MFLYGYFSVESPVLSRLKQNRKRRQLQNDEDHTSSPKGACKRLRLEKISEEEEIEDKSEELAVDVPETPEELDENSSQRTEETSDDRSEEPESSPTKVILREADLIKFTKPFEIYLTPLTKEEIDRYTKITLSSSSSDSEFYAMASV